VEGVSNPDFLARKLSANPILS